MADGGKFSRYQRQTRSAVLAAALSQVYNPHMSAKQLFSEQLRQAVENSDKSRYQISKQTGIAQSVLSRFINEDAGLSMESIDKLCDCLDLSLIRRVRK